MNSTGLWNVFVCSAFCYGHSPPCSNGSATSEDLFWKLDALQMFVMDLHWPEPEFAKHLEQRLKLMASDMMVACVKRLGAFSILTAWVNITRGQPTLSACQFLLVFASFLDWHVFGHHSIAAVVHIEGVNSMYTRVIDSAKTLLVALIGCFCVFLQLALGALRIIEAEALDYLSKIINHDAKKQISFFFFQQICKKTQKNPTFF